MQRVSSIKSVGSWNTAEAVDRVVLDAEDRHRRRMVLTGEGGTSFLLDMPHPVALRDGDGLLLESGSIVRVVGLAESLVEITAKTPHDVVRLAWHLGNRHTDVQIVDGKLRIRRDHVLEDMVIKLGASVTPIDAPFDPEGGAHSHGHAGGHHGHGHHHGDH
ncbi:MAG TPA: urease accessory protein UreE [Xanthobacteraceae bacterium]|jgi:urease accessory protein|nr:urease accessory protein UreE [Xanthobacteraceae bacterium]